jgi:tRNA-dihydrouridine synthase 1
MPPAEGVVGRSLDDEGVAAAAVVRPLPSPRARESELPELRALGTLEERMAASAEKGWELYRRLGSPKNVAAPMVEGSMLAFRHLCRRYGAQLCYTPMINSKPFAIDATMRANCWEKGNGEPADRPLVVQFAGHSAESLKESARYVQTQCDAIDINLGCPQHIAKRGKYGAFLLEEWQLLQHLVHELSTSILVPVTCKIRLLENLEDTIALAQLLAGAGCAILTVHGRTRHMVGPKIREANWDAIRAIRAAVPIPVFANGGIFSADDVARCIQETGVAAVMSSEALLGNPAFFSRGMRAGQERGDHPPVTPKELALEYLELSRQYPSPRHPTAIVKSHIFKILHQDLQVHTDLRARLGQSFDMPSVLAICAELWKRGAGDAEPSTLSWYYRHWGEKRESLPDWVRDQGCDEDEDEKEEEDRLCCPEFIDEINTRNEGFSLLFPRSDEDE